MRNFYLLLGIPVTATDAEVKKAFRREARETHPDSVGGSGERFQNVKEAHETLGDPEKRRRYDSERAAWAKRIGACICVVCGSANTIRRRPKNGETVVCAGCQSPLPIDLNSAINLQKIRLASEAVKVIDSVGAELAEAAVDILSAQIGKLRQRFTK